LIEQKKERRKREGGRDIREIWLLTYIHRPIKNKAEREREREREREIFLEEELSESTHVLKALIWNERGQCFCFVFEQKDMCKEKRRE
jgi:hypothetical protein